MRNKGMKLEVELKGLESFKKIIKVVVELMKDERIQEDTKEEYKNKFLKLIDEFENN